MKTLDFSGHKLPVLPVKLRGGAEIKVLPPSVALTEELQEELPTLEGVLGSGDAAAAKAVYGLCARLLSCNRQGLEITSEDLLSRYALSAIDLYEFFTAYTNFIEQIQNQKN